MPRCRYKVKFYMSTTEDHDGCVFYIYLNQGGNGCDFWHWEREYVAYLVDHHYLVGHEVVDAIGATEDRRELLEREREERIRAFMVGSRGTMNITTAQAGAFLTLGMHMLLLLKLLLGGVPSLVVLSVMLVMKQ
ncbi:Secologanin synthase [Hordeum vulgare]|nr:Secologanin synthase [Hordeum vulgare]